MAFDDPQFGVGNRNLIRPVIEDSDLCPCLADACALRWCLHVVMQIANVLRPFARRADPVFAWQRHRRMLSPSIVVSKP